MRKLRAYLRLLKGKILRDRMSPNRVAAGWAIGMFIGCSIPFGFQLIVSIPAAVLTKTSKIGATVGTFITNPLTIFFIYPAQTWAVYRLLFGGNPELPSTWTWETVKGLAGKTIASFFLGGILLGAILSPIMFFTVRRLVLVSRAAIERRARHESQEDRRDLP